MTVTAEVPSSRIPLVGPSGLPTTPWFNFWASDSRRVGEIEAIEIIAGSGLIGGGTLAADITFNIGAGTGIVVNANDVQLDLAHARNVDHSVVSISPGTGLTGGGTIEATRTLGLANTAVTPATYGSATQIAQFTVDAQGRLTFAQNVTPAVVPTTDGDYGDITVSGAGTVWTIDAGVVSLAKMANMATASLIYRKTAGAGAPEVQTLATLKTDLGLSGTNTGDQTITLTGGVTGSGTGSFATTIAANAVNTGQLFNDAVTYAKIQNVSATDRLLGRSTAGAGDIEEIVCTAAGRAILDDADAAAQRVTLVLGPADTVTFDTLFATSTVSSNIGSFTNANITALNVIGPIDSADTTDASAIGSASVVLAGGLSVALSTYMGGDLTLYSADAGTAGRQLIGHHDSASPAGSDVVFRILAKGEDSVGNSQDYARLDWRIISPTSGAETGGFVFRWAAAGTLTPFMIAQATQLSPLTDGLLSLGVVGTAWSGLALTAAGTITWGATDVVITGGTNTLAFTGASSGYSFDALVTSTAQIRAYLGTAPPAAGAGNIGIHFSSTSNLGVICGTGAPTVSSAKGTIYIRTDATTTTTRLYINTDGGTTWTTFTTAA